MASNLVYSTLLFLAAIVSATLALIAWQRRSTPGALAACLFSLAMCWWSATYALHWSGVPRPSPYFWLDLTYVGVVTVPAFFWVFVLRYTDRGHWLNRTVIACLFIEPILTLALFYTDSYHGLFFAGKRASASNSIYNGGPWFWTNAIYQYGLNIASVALLFRACHRAPNKMYLRQAGVVLTGALIPWALNIICFAGLNPLPGLDLTPIAFTLTGYLISVSLFRYHLLDLKPVARDTLIEHMSDGVIVLDPLNRIIDINPAGQRLLGRDARALIGRAIESLQEQWPISPLRAVGDEELQTEAQSVSDASRYLDVRFVRMPLSRGERQGQIVILRDISRRKRLEGEREHLIETLQDALSQVKTLSGLLPICANCKKIRDDSGYWQQLEVYLSEHTEAGFTHGICPDCMKKLYPEFVDQEEASRSL